MRTIILAADAAREEDMKRSGFWDAAFPVRERHMTSLDDLDRSANIRASFFLGIEHANSSKHGSRHYQITIPTDERFVIFKMFFDKEYWVNVSDYATP